MISSLIFIGFCVGFFVYQFYRNHCIPLAIDTEYKESIQYLKNMKFFEYFHIGEYEYEIEYIKNFGFHRNNGSSLKDKAINVNNLAKFVKLYEKELYIIFKHGLKIQSVQRLNKTFMVDNNENRQIMDNIIRQVRDYSLYKLNDKEKAIIRAYVPKYDDTADVINKAEKDDNEKTFEEILYNTPSKTETIIDDAVVNITKEYLK